MTAQSRKAYPTDLSDSQWDLVHPLLPRKVGKGRNQAVPLREIVNAIFYWLRTGCQWRNLPHDFPPHDTVFYHYNKWKKKGVWKQMLYKGGVGTFSLYDAAIHLMQNQLGDGNVNKLVQKMVNLQVP